LLRLSADLGAIMSPMSPGTVIPWIARVANAIWRWHFNIPEPAYWLALILGSATFTLTLVLALPGGGWFLAASSFATLLAVQGIARWHFHRASARGALVAPRFAASEPSHATQIQEMLMTALKDDLSEGEAARVHAVPAVVGSAQRVFATRVFRRLRAHMLLHGDIRERRDGGLSVYARVLQPLPHEVIHADPHTRDVTPARVRWRYLFQRLSPQDEVREVEYPLEFAEEIKALVRGVAGQFAGALGDYPRAERLLREALQVSAESRSHAVDQLRVDLAMVVADQGRHDEAIETLRERAEQADASPELLRGLWRLLSMHRERPFRVDVEPENRDEVIALLRRAADHRADPQRDLTLYNLANLLMNESPAEDQEARQIIDDLLSSSSHYRDAWYVHQARGGMAYAELTKAYDAADWDTVRAKGKEAARFYSRAVRLRPRFQLLWRGGWRVFLLARFPPSPILHANARDAHDQARHPLRTNWHEWRFQHHRKRMLKRGGRFLRRGRFEDAYAAFDWAVVGRHDLPETQARTFAAIALHQTGDDEAEQRWQDARSQDPHAILIRAAIASNPSRYVLPKGLPGDDPSDPGGAADLFVRDGGLIEAL